MQAAEAWKKATEEERAPHVAAAEQEKEVYEKASVEYGVNEETATAVNEETATAGKTAEGITHWTEEEEDELTALQVPRWSSHNTYHVTISTPHSSHAFLSICRV